MLVENWMGFLDNRVDRLRLRQQTPRGLPTVHRADFRPRHLTAFLRRRGAFRFGGAPGADGMLPRDRCERRLLLNRV